MTKVNVVEGCTKKAIPYISIKLVRPKKKYDREGILTCFFSKFHYTQLTYNPTCLPSFRHGQVVKQNLSHLKIFCDRKLHNNVFS